MLTRALFRGLLVCFVTLSGPITIAAPSTRLALVGGMLLDGYGGAPVHHAAILIENNRIVAAGDASAVVIPPGTPIVDTHGETMMPRRAERFDWIWVLAGLSSPRSTGCFAAERLVLRCPRQRP